MAKEKITPNSIAEQLNQHKYEDLKVFLRKDVDWFSLAPSSILPREKVRAFVTSIDDEEVRLAVMKFLVKYAYDYFLAMAKEDTEIDFRVGISSIEDQEREALKKVDAFQKELNFQIDLIISSGEFSGDTFHKLEEKIKALEKELKRKDEDLDNLDKLINELEEKINRFKHPEKYGKYIPAALNNPMFRAIMEYLQAKQIVLPLYSDSAYGKSIRCYRWYGSKGLFGYYVEKLNEEFELNEAREQRNWQIFESVFENYDKLVDEARKAVSRYRKNNKALLPAKADFVDEAIKYANGDTRFPKM